MAKSRRLLEKTIGTIEGEKAAICTIGRRMPGCVFFLHRYHPETGEREIFL
jgi:hypothetical protein